MIQRVTIQESEKSFELGCRLKIHDRRNIQDRITVFHIFPANNENVHDF